MNYKNKYVMFAIIILIISLFTSTCYAKFSDIPLTTYAYSNAEMDSVFIKDISITDNVNADISNSEIINFTKTMMYSKVTLSDTDINSTLTMTLSIYNYGPKTTTFEKVLTDILDTSIYSNSNIDYTLNSLQSTDQINSMGHITFTITFKYSDDYKISNPQIPYDNTLTSYLNFKFGHDFVTRFDNNHGECESINDYYVEYGQPLLDLDNELPTRTGYIFMGWFDNKDYLNGNMFYDEEQNRLDLKDIPYDKYNITLYAGWEPIKYTVTYYKINSVMNNTIKDIPNEYVPITYLESDGDVFFDINYTPNDNTIIESEFILSSTNTFGLYGNINRKTDGGYRLFEYNNNLYASRGSGVQNQAFNLLTETKYHLQHSKSELTINNTNYLGGSSGNSYYPIFLLKDGYTDGDKNRPPYKFVGKLFYFKIYEGNIVVRNYIPVINLNTNNIGLYDTINNVFYMSDGTNKLYLEYEQYTYTYDKSFKINYDMGINFWNTSLDETGIYYKGGQEVSNLTNINNDNIKLFQSTEYQIIFNNYGEKDIYKYNNSLANDFKAPVITNSKYTFLGWKNTNGIKYFDEYGKMCVDSINSNIELIPIFFGNNIYQKIEYIETDGEQYIDLKYTPNQNTIIESEFMLTSNETFGLYGNKFGQTNGGFRTFKFSGLLYASNGGAVQYQNFPLNINTRYSLIHNRSLYKINNITYNDGDNGNNYYPMILLKDGYTDTDKNRPPYKFVGKLFYFKIYEGDIVVRNFIPVINLTSGSVELYDTVYEVFYENDGSGEFISGPTIE